MAYTPLNVSVFTAAYAGALSGMSAGQKQPLSAVAAAYSPLAALAGAWAQAFDTAWGAGAAAAYAVEAIREMSQSTWMGRVPPNTAAAALPATYTPQVNSLITAINAGQTYLTAQGVNALGSASQGNYGDGSDGVAAFDGVTVVPGATLAGSTYTMTRDVFYSNVTVSAPVTLKTAGFRFYANGIVTNAGIISNDGGAAALAVAGAASPAGSLGASFAGGAGSTGAGVGTAGTNATAAISATQGMGGAGGAGGASAGGAASTSAALTAAQGSPRILPNALLGAVTANAATVVLRGGAGGGGGGVDGVTTTGGAGGGGGGVMVFAALTLINTGTIRTAGGAGSAGAGGAANGGGGGGGGGGALLLISRNVTNTGSIAAPGGAPGAGILAGIAGAVGTAGVVVTLVA